MEINNEIADIINIHGTYYDDKLINELSQLISTREREAYDKGKESERWIRGDYTTEMVQKIKKEAVEDMRTWCLKMHEAGADLKHWVERYGKTDDEITKLNENCVYCNGTGIVYDNDGVSWACKNCTSNGFAYKDQEYIRLDVAHSYTRTAVINVCEDIIKELIGLRTWAIEKDKNFMILESVRLSVEKIQEKYLTSQSTNGGKI
jgi:hypothetical protein